MKMMTLNCHSLLDYNPERQIQELVDQIVREEIDVFSLQEVNQSRLNFSVGKKTLVKQGYHRAEDDLSVVKADNFAYRLSLALSRVKLKFNWSWLKVREAGDLEVGTAVFSRLTLDQVKKINLETSQILLASLNDEDHTVVCSATFNGQAPYIFEQEWDNFQLALKQYRLMHDPIYVLGDFNVDAETDEHHYSEMCKCFTDTYHTAISKGDGMTVRGSLNGWDDHGISQRVDYILTSDEAEVSYSRVCFDGILGPRISSHAGILIEVQKEACIC